MGIGGFNLDKIAKRLQDRNPAFLVGARQGGKTTMWIEWIQRLHEDAARQVAEAAMCEVMKVLRKEQNDAD